MDERLKLAYATAMRAQHEGGRVEIHIGSDARAELVARCKITVAGEERRWDIPAPTLFGFPLVDTTASPDHISVHVVHAIA